MKKTIAVVSLVLLFAVLAHAQVQQVPAGPIPVNDKTVDLTSFVTTALDQLSTAYSGLFVSMAQNFLRPFLTAAIFMSGVTWLISGHRAGVAAFISAVITYLGVAYALKFYITPMPIIGVPFSDIFRVEGRFLQAQIDIGLLNVFLANISDLFSGNGKGMAQPNPWNLFETLGYYAVMVAMALPEIALFVETSTAIIALGIGALLGPIAIILKLLPFKWTQNLFWGWFHFMVKYALFRVFASAIVYVACTAQMLFITQVFNGDYSLPSFMARLLGLLVFNIGIAVMCMRVGHLVSDFTTGHGNAGGGVMNSVASFSYAVARFA